MIILDVFTGGSEPAHLLTVEALAQLHGLLTNQRILVLNFVSFLDNGQNPALASVAKTLVQVLPHQQVFISDPNTDFNDFIFLTTNHAINLNDASFPDTHRTWLKQRLVNIDQSQGMTLTDKRCTT